MNETRHAPARDVAVSDDRYSTSHAPTGGDQILRGPAGLPTGWNLVRLADIALSIQYGHTASAKARPERPRFLRITDIQEGKVDWDSVPSCDIGAAEIPKYQLADGDIVFARTGATTGKSFLISNCPEAVFASYLIRLRIAPGISPRYVHAFFQSADYWRQIEASKRGIGQPNVNGQVLSRLTLPLPPLDEQQRIVTEIEKQFTRLEAGAASLKRVQAALKRYRASLLKAACEGRLVPTKDTAKQTPFGDLIGGLGQGWSPKCDLTREPLPDEWAIVTTTAVQSMRYVDNQGKPLPAKFAPRPHLEIKPGRLPNDAKGATRSCRRGVPGPDHQAEVDAL